MSVLVRAASVSAAVLSAHSLVNARLLPTPRAAPGCSGLVSALVPARDEQARIGACVRALLAQQGVDVEVVVCDDGSRDATAAAARRAGGQDPRLRVLAGRTLPPGWLGKPHACAQLAEAARGDVLVFVDADVVVAPGGLAATTGLLRTAGLDLVSPYPRQIAVSAAERLVQPLLQWSWLTFLPLRLAERSPRPSLAAANGQLLGCDAVAYRRAGGHAAVRDHVIEDIGLARAFKRAGLRVALADGTAIASCRMYPGWHALRDGYSKSLWAAFGSPAGAAGALALLGWLYLLPPAAAVFAVLRRRPLGGLAGLLGYGAAVVGRAVCARRTGSPPADALAHPASIALLAALTLHSLRARARGQLAWKGRPVG